MTTTSLAKVLALEMRPDGGFLPDLVPLDRLSPPLDGLIQAADEVPYRFAGGVRGWLDERFRVATPEVTEAIAGLGPRGRARLAAALSVLGHAYRWDRVPARPEAFALGSLALPPGLEAAWQQVSRASGVPRVGSMWTLVLENWHHTDLQGGTRFRAADLTRDCLRLAHGWLLPPDDALLEHWSLLILETEARGAPVVRALVAALDAAREGDVDLVGRALERLRADFEAMADVFVRGVRNASLDPDRWATHVGPIYGWGLREPEGVLEGLSGMQFGAYAAVSAGLGVPAGSRLAVATRHNRRYLPPSKQRFLAAIDQAAPALVDLIKSSRDPALRRRYDDVLRSVRAWRTVHRQRGALYVRASVAALGTGGSTGLTLQDHNDPTRTFKALMTERIDETRAAEVGTPEPSHEYVILGAGPAGLQLAHHLQTAGRDCVVLEAGATAGTSFRHYPRHRTLLLTNKVHTGLTDPEQRLRHDWNSVLSEHDPLLFGSYSEQYFPPADDLVRYLQDYAAHHRLPVHCGVRVTRVDRDADGFRLLDDQGRVYRCSTLVVATGFAREHAPAIPGIELAESYGEADLEPSRFRSRRVLILGKGNSAFETADALIPEAAVIHLVSRSSVRLAWQTHYVGDLRAVNNNFLDTYQLKSQNAVLDAEVTGIRREGDELVVSLAYRHAEGEIEDRRYDHVLRCTGFALDTSIFGPTTMPALTCEDRLPALTERWESVDQPGLYFAGVLMQGRDHRKGTSGFIHGFRYNVRALARLLLLEHQGSPLARRAVASDHGSITHALLDRANRCSALWQQFGVLGDALLVDPDGVEGGWYYEELPVAWLCAHLLPEAALAYVLTLEFGGSAANPFAAPRVHRNRGDRGAESNFLHPVVRRYQRGDLVGVHHVLEDLDADWWRPEHQAPLAAWVAGRQVR